MADPLDRVISLTARLRRSWFRERASGLEHVPDTPCVLVANHGIGVPWELLAVFSAWRGQFGRARELRVLAHDMWFRFPGLAGWLRSLGCVPATMAEAEGALQSGCDVLVFPGGVREETRPFWRWREVDLHGRLGWARIARSAGAPLVPVAITGSHLTNPVLVSSGFFAWVTGLRLFGVSRMPITLGQVLVALAFFFGLRPFLSLPLTAVLTWLAMWAPSSVFLPVLPARIEVTFCDARPAPGEGEHTLSESYAAIESALQAAVSETAAARGGWLG